MEQRLAGRSRLNLLLGMAEACPLTRRCACTDLPEGCPSGEYLDLFVYMMTTRPREHSAVDETAAELVVVGLVAGVHLHDGVLLHIHRMTLSKRALVGVLNGVV